MRVEVVVRGESLDFRAPPLTFHDLKRKRSAAATLLYSHTTAEQTYLHLREGAIFKWP